MKFRKKPVEVEAIQFQAPVSVSDVLDFCEGSASVSTWHPLVPVIHTLEGNHLCSPGDWIIKGVKGEFYPCKPDVFAMTYEPVDPSVEEGPRPVCNDPACPTTIAHRGPCAPPPEAHARCERCEGRGTMALPWVNGPDVKCSRCGGAGTAK